MVTEAILAGRAQFGVRFGSDSVTQTLDALQQVI